MLVETTKDTLCINQIIGQKKDTAIVEEDFVVPDVKPDILSTINTNGTVCVYKKEIMDGKIKIDGCINAYIMYLADAEQNQIRSLNTNLNFSQTIDFLDLRMGMMVQSDIEIKSIECRVLNGRKINVRVILDVNLKAYSNENLEFVKQIDTIKDVQLLKEKFNINSLLGMGNTKVYAKDTVVIDNIDELAEIMKVNIDIKNKETKISYNKILIKADAIVKIMYLTQDNRICTKISSIPIMGFMDMPDVSEENICDVKYEIKNILLKPNSIEEHSVYVEIEIEINCNVYKKLNLDIIQDLYSPSANLIYKQKIIKAMSQRVQMKDLCSIREKQFISEIGRNKLYDVDIKPYIVSESVMKDKVVYQGEIELKFIFSSGENSKVEAKTVIIPFNYNMNCPGAMPNAKVDTSIEVVMEDFVIMPDESIDIKIDLQFGIEINKNQDINIIQEINIEENRDVQKYSIIIYFTKPGDSLWKIAKSFKSTVNAIATLNGIEDESKIDVGEQLFIPIAI